MVSHCKGSPLSDESRTRLQNVPPRLQEALQVPLVDLEVGQILHCLVIVWVQPEGLHEALRSLGIVSASPPATASKSSQKQRRLDGSATGLIPCKCAGRLQQHAAVQSKPQGEEKGFCLLVLSVEQP